MKIKKTFIYSLIFLIAALQCLFIGSIIYEQQNHLFVFPFILLFVFLLISYFHTYIKEYHIAYDSWKIAIWIFIGAVSVWLLRQYLSFDSVLATATVGVIAGAIPLFFKKNHYVSQLPAAIYCGAFIAMSNIKNDIVFVFFAASISFFAYILAKSIMNGIGGKLGTIAFVGVVVAYLLIYLSKWI